MSWKRANCAGRNQVFLLSLSILNYDNISSINIMVGFFSYLWTYRKKERISFLLYWKHEDETIIIAIIIATTIIIVIIRIVTLCYRAVLLADNSIIGDIALALAVENIFLFRRRTQSNINRKVEFNWRILQRFLPFIFQLVVQCKITIWEVLDIQATIQTVLIAFIKFLFPWIRGCSLNLIISIWKAIPVAGKYLMQFIAFVAVVIKGNRSLLFDIS